jgi:HK97 family phage major capsid protein
MEGFKMPTHITKGELLVLIEDAAKKLLEVELRKFAKMPMPGGPDIMPHDGPFGGGSADGIFGKSAEPIRADGFKSFADWVRTCAFQPGDIRLTKVMSEGEPSAGGFAVPIAYNTELLRMALEKSQIFAGVRAVPLTTLENHFATIDDTTHATGTTFGGIKFTFTDELVEKTPSEPSLGEIILKAKTAASILLVSNQLLADAPTMDRDLQALFSESLGWFYDDMIMRGTGAGQPRGIKGAPGTVVVAKESGQAAGTIVFPNIRKMFGRMPGQFRESCVWIVSPSATDALLGMSIPVGTGGSAVMLANQSAIAPVPTEMYGRPIVWSEHCENLGAEGDIYLVNLASYLFGIREGLSLFISAHRYAELNKTMMRFETRIDGCPIFSSPLTIRSGASFTVSPMVTLALRT